jgi:hypothetical protein
VTEAGIWRDADPAGGGLYRETWLTLGVGRLSGSQPRKVEVVVSWGSGASARVTRTYWLAAYERTPVSLDTMLPPGWPPVQRADALIEIVADGPVWAETAIYYQPLARGVVASRAQVRFECVR